LIEARTFPIPLARADAEDPELKPKGALTSGRLVATSGRSYSAFHCPGRVTRDGHRYAFESHDAAWFKPEILEALLTTSLCLWELAGHQAPLESPRTSSSACTASTAPAGAPTAAPRFAPGPNGAQRSGARRSSMSTRSALASAARARTEPRFLPFSISDT